MGRNHKTTQKIVIEKSDDSIEDKSSFDTWAYEDEKRNLSTGEKMKEFVSDHSDNLGCLTFFLAIGLLSWGGYEGYQHMKEKKQAEVLFEAQAREDAKKIEGSYIRALIPFAPKMSKENAPRILEAVKYIVLIEQPTMAPALDILRKKYEKEYSEQSNNSQFSDFLLIRLREDSMTKISQIPVFSNRIHSFQFTR